MRAIDLVHDIVRVSTSFTLLLLAVRASRVTTATTKVTINIMDSSRLADFITLVFLGKLRDTAFSAKTTGILNEVYSPLEKR